MLSVQRDKFPVFCYGESPYILPVGWCSRNKIPLQFGPGEISSYLIIISFLWTFTFNSMHRSWVIAGQVIPDPVKFWKDTIEQTKLECAQVVRVREISEI